MVTAATLGLLATLMVTAAAFGLLATLMVAAASLGGVANFLDDSLTLSSLLAAVVAAAGAKAECSNSKRNYKLFHL